MDAILEWKAAGSARATALLVTTALLAVAGAALAQRILTGSLDVAAPAVVREAPDDGAWTAATSFGEISVRRVERFHAAGRARVHGGHATTAGQLRLAVQLKNRIAGLVHSPGQFRLRVAATGTTITAIDAAAERTLLPQGTSEERLAFVVPASRSAFSLEFDDLGRRSALLIDLGSIAVPAADRQS